MSVRTTSLEAELESLEEKAEEYDRRINTEKRVDEAKSNLNKLNGVLRELESTLDDFERQSGMLTEVFGESLPSEAVTARNTVRSLLEFSQDDILDIIDDGSRSLSDHISDLRKAREKLKDAIKTVNDQLKEIRRAKLSEANTAEAIQKIVGESEDAMTTISQYRSFLRSILNPIGSVSEQKRTWQGLEKAFENLDTDWEGFQRRHGLSPQTVEDLKTLSQDGNVDLDELTTESVTEMMEVPELRSTIKVSI